MKRKRKVPPPGYLVAFARELFPEEIAHRADCIMKARQPRTLYGSPETIIDDGISGGIRETAKWADRIVASIGEASSAGEILARMKRAAAGNSLKAFSRDVYESLLRGATLGALDSNWEGETGGTIEPAKFVDIPPLPGYADKPFAEAISWFKSKEILSPLTFRRLDAAAKRRAFSIARAANVEMLNAAHAELTRQLEAGADLRSFKKFAKERLESAGWVPANKSHVELVFRNNVVGGYGGGRHAEMHEPAVLKARPIFQVRGVGDSRMRDNHRAVNGVAVRADDPVWRNLWPPFGHNCRCRVTSRSESDAKRLGLEVVGGGALAPVPDHGWRSTGSLAA